MFSVDLKSKRHVKSISVSDEAHDRVLFEGDLGELVELSIVEGDVLEIIGVNGVLRIGISEDQLRKAFADQSRRSNPSAKVGRFTSAKKKG